MKRRLLSLFLVLSLALSLVMIPASADDGTPQPLQASTVQAVYLACRTTAPSPPAKRAALPTCSAWTAPFRLSGIRR